MAKAASKPTHRPPFLKAALIGLTVGLVGAMLQFGAILHTSDEQLTFSVEKLLAKASDTAKIAIAAPALGVGDALSEGLMQAGYIEQVKLLNAEGKLIAGRKATHGGTEKRARLEALLDHLGFAPRTYGRKVTMAPDPNDPTDKGATGTLQLTVDRAGALAASMSRATAIMLLLAFTVVGAAGTASTLGFWHTRRKKEALKRMQARS
ncbi:hypothetical protein [Kordiimonas marina]|uniref:hypothetical protein n=1 Tax=Kordiimonas marina TaxID=2872312 RepID=UPI001FF25620|nr:hypothetical protein [Kordiimonas marina]MCJ9429106.1 hypothetical protein [Kordiimonas marina]